MSGRRSKPWHHLPDGTFRNPKGSPRRNATARDAAPFFADMLRRSFERVEIPDGHVIERAEAVARLERLWPEDTLTWLGHASFLVRLGGKTILTDPYLTAYAGPMGLGPRRFVKSGISIRDLPPIDILVVSHNHYDHLDEKALLHLRGKDTMTVVVPLGLGSFFTERGFANVEEVDWHESRRFGGVEVMALPVVHWSRRLGQPRNTTLWAGFAFRSTEHTVFFGGDSGYGPVFRETGDRHGPFDTALLGIGAYEPRAIMEASHATPEEAVQMGLDLKARRLVGMHWGTVTLTSEPPFEPPVRFRAAGLDAGFAPEDLWVMAIGESRLLKGAWPSNR